MTTPLQLWRQLVLVLSLAVSKLCIAVPHWSISVPAAHGRSMVGSEYVCVGSPEETLLETYFIMLSKFNFDRAKDQCVSTAISTSVYVCLLVVL